MSATKPRFRIGIDTGGTFTDIVSVDADSGAMRVIKVASTPDNPAIGLVRGVNAVLAAANAFLVVGVSLLYYLITATQDWRVAAMLAVSIACGYVYQGPPFRCVSACQPSTVLV